MDADAADTPSAPKPRPLGTPSVEERLLDLFQGHLKSNEEAVRELGTKCDAMAEKIESTSNRVFYLALAILLVLAAATGSNIYISYAGAEVVTGTSAP